MRKLLCILAVIWACSMVAFAAEYTDQASIKNQEAVTMLSDLGVFSGYEDGSFRPMNTISREEISTVITYLSTEESYVAEQISFEDTQYSWASNYIEYCADAGIISGSNGKFRPKDNVTGYELTKMILVLLGHSNETLLGENWKENVYQLAKSEGILSGFDGDLNQYVSRDKAAYLLNNALQCHVVESYQEDGTINYVLDMMRNPLALLEIRFSAKLVNGVLLANNQYDFRPGQELTADNTIHIEGYAKDFKVSPEIANNNQLLGHKITVYAIVGMDYNRIVGTVKNYSKEIAIPMNSYTAMEEIMEKTAIHFAEDVSFVMDFQIVPQETVLAQRKEIEMLTMVDHEGDNGYDMIFIKLKQPEEKPE